MDWLTEGAVELAKNHQKRQTNWGEIKNNLFQFVFLPFLTSVFGLGNRDQHYPQGMSCIEFDTMVMEFCKKKMSKNIYCYALFHFSIGQFISTKSLN